MRQVGTVLAAVGAVAVVAGCGTDSPESAALPTTEQLRTTIQHAQAAQRSVVTTTTTTTTGGGAGDGATVCKIELVPIKASDCTTDATRMITLPDAVYLHTAGSTPAGWQRSPNSGDDGFDRALHDMAKDPVLSHGVSTVAAQTTDTVDGVSATRYDLTIDPKAMTDVMNKHLGGSGETALTITRAAGTIWVGGNGLIAKEEVDMTVQGQQPTTVTVTYTDWNAPLAIAAPPADQAGPTR